MRKCYSLVNGRLRLALQNQTGVALILVLMLLSLLVVIVYTFAYTTRVNLRLARNRAADLQIIYLGKAGIEAAKAVLNNDHRHNSYDWLGDNWAKPFPPVRNVNATILVRITDEARKINLNNLVLDKKTAPKSKDKIASLRMKVKDRIRRAIANLDLGINARRLSNQIEQRIIMGRVPTNTLQGDDSPFIGWPIYTLDELLEFDEVNKVTLYGNQKPENPPPALSDVLTIASAGLININTAPKEVLQALHIEMTELQTNTIIKKRKEVEGFRSLTQFSEMSGLSDSLLTEIQPLLTTVSKVFSLSIEIERGQIKRMIRSILQRPISSKTSKSMPLLLPDRSSIQILQWNDISK